MRIFIKFVNFGQRFRKKFKKQCFFFCADLFRVISGKGQWFFEKNKRRKRSAKFGWNFECWAVRKRVIFVDLVKSFQTSVLRMRGNLFFSNRTVLCLPSRLRFSVCSLFFFKEPTFPERAPGGSHPSGGPHLAGPASFFKKNITQNALSFGIEGLT